jgi:Flp pilus assembly protein TadG
MRPLLRSPLQLLRARKCVAAIEFALVVPVFILLLAGTIDLASAVYTWTRLQSALAVGANYALLKQSMVNSANAQSLADTIASLVSTSNAGNAANVTVDVNHGIVATLTVGSAVSNSGSATNADSCYCPSGAAGDNWTWGSTFNCSPAPACTTGSTTAGKFVMITASYTFTPMFSGYQFVSSGTMSASAGVQVQ